MSNLIDLKIILVEPAGALNVGSVARVMKNMGLRRLILVNPQCDYLGEEARRMAVHGVELLESATRFESLPEALRGCQRAIATTSRSRTLSTPLETPRVALPWLLEKEISSALIFGPEDRGLNNSELNYAQRFVCIPANSEYPSLNLAQAVAVCAYELYQSQHLAPSEQEPSVDNSAIASLDAIEGYYQHLETVLLEIGYLYPHTAASRLEKFRSLYKRANLTSEEVALLRGILGQVEWLLTLVPEDKKPRSSFGSGESEMGNRE
jgi:tRNA/rRNA methyltransferase